VALKDLGKVLYKVRGTWENKVKRKLANSG